MNTKDLGIKLGLLISLMIFLGFGFFHITKFETVDEHFWKDERIKEYWRGLKEGVTVGDWRKTHINDKPGITVAIISGIPGLIMERNPEVNRIRDTKATEDGLYTVYDETMTRKVNLAFRSPLLLFNAFFLVFLFWLLSKIVSYQSAALAVALMAVSPVLIGVSQVINPDTLLWGFSVAAISSYLALLKKEEKKFLLLTIFFTGLSLLTKYTANILFPIFILLFVSKAIIDYDVLNKAKNLSGYMKRRVIEWFGILVSVMVMFSIFMPSVFKKPEHLWYGTIDSPASAPIFLPMVIFLLVLFLESYSFENRFSKVFFSFLFKYKQIVFKTVSLATLSLFLLVLVNPWLPNPVIPLKNVKENAFVDKELIFPMIPDYPEIVKFPIKMGIEAGPFVFSLLPIIIILVLALWIKIVWKGLKNNQLLVFFITFFIPSYFAMLLFAGVLANPRYAIMLYPLVAILAALAVSELFSKKLLKKVVPVVFVLVILTGGWALWSIKPFYLTYENSILPNKYFLSDAWGYGGYEAAQYLNSLPNSENIIIWSDQSAICLFLKGKCIGDYKIDLSKTVPDYFVFSRRGSIRHKFEWEKPELAPHDNFYYYKQKPIWEINIGGRPSSYIRIVPFDPKK